MNKEEALEKVFKIDYTQLVPSTLFKSEIYFLTIEEFEQLRKHMEISDIQMSVNNYDTIIISNMIFKNQIN
jgi:hypothetical protein